MNTNRLKFLLDTKFLIYIFKCIIGVVLTYSLHLAFPDHKLYWGIVSFVLVISPDDIESKKLSINRIKANVIGAIVGLLFFLISPTTNILIICIGILSTIFICYILSLQGVMRMAMAGFVIVMIFQTESNSYLIAVFRMLSVILGSCIAIFITNIFNLFLNIKKDSIK